MSDYKSQKNSFKILSFMLLVLNFIETILVRSNAFAFLLKPQISFEAKLSKNIVVKINETIRMSETRWGKTLSVLSMGEW